MFCPRCATQNADETRFCRGCGANLSLIPQALSGKLQETGSSRGRNRSRDHESGLAAGITEFSVGVGFLVLAGVLWISRMWWGIWLLIPAFAMLGKGLAKIVTARYSAHTPPLTTVGADPIPQLRRSEIPPPAVSVTEDTTRELDAAIDRPNRR